MKSISMRDLVSYYIRENCADSVVVVILTPSEVEYAADIENLQLELQRLGLEVPTRDDLMKATGCLIIEATETTALKLRLRLEELDFGLEVMTFAYGSEGSKRNGI